YLDLGLERCRRHVLKLYEPVFQDLQEGILRKDYKTQVQELAQSCFGITPEYRIVHESGPDHDKTFYAEIVLNNRSIGQGRGRSKKESEQAAAKEAWTKLTRD
ncbi:MAG TPA: ribonuclease III, partial [Firmicutes bacterium]|nr:ribonuclease III [Bacillota bacterium]